MGNSTASQPEANQPLRELQPTVFVGLGGTGKEVLLRLRRQILSTRWKDVRLGDLAQFPIAQFLYFDVDSQSAQESDRAVATDLLSEAVHFSPSETLQKPLDLQMFLSNRRAYPLIDEFFPNQELRGINVLHGAAQIRALSRLYFFQRYQDFRGMLQNKALAAVASLQNREYMQKLGLDVDPGNRHRVVVVASAAGGTGSGSFLDVGYLASSLQDPPAESVTLVLLLGGAYQDANAIRVYANTFAALKELEGCMRNPEWPRYVSKWDATDQQLPQMPPFKDVYLVDSANVLNQRTNRKEDLFAMLASILFEDFGSSEFSKHKRSVASNNQQFKLKLYDPPLPAGFENAMSYSAGYSAFGQTTLETISRRSFERRNYELAAEMLQGFFSVGNQRKANSVTDEQLYKFLHEKLYLDETGFKVLADRSIQKFFSQAPADLPSSLKLYSLVSRLLSKPDGSTLFKGVIERVEAAIDTTKSRADFSQWKESVKDAFEDLEISLQGKVGAKEAAPRAREIDDAARRISQDWFSDGTLGLRAEIFDLVKDHRRGGIHYALDLMHQIKDRLGDRKHGIIGELAETRDLFKRWAEKCKEALYEVPLQNLTELSGRRARSQGETILAEGVKPLMCKCAELQLYALACDKSVELLESLSDQFLGKPQATREDDTQWTGLIGEVDTGRQHLIDLLQNFQIEITQLSDARETPMQQYIADGYKFPDQPPLEEMIGWANDAFDKMQLESGGLFKRLASPEGKFRVMEDLRLWVRDNSGKTEGQLPSMTQVLSALGEAASAQLARLMLCAAPWVDADTHRMEGFRGEQYKMFLAVDGKHAFEQAFNTVIQKARPGEIQVSVVESGVPGKLICYSELSGIPLDALKPVRSTYLNAYRRESGRIPLHNHRDDVRFPNPVVPDQAAIDEQSATVKTYLQAIIFNILQRGTEPTHSEPGERGNAYFIERNPGEWSGIGLERRILNSTGAETPLTRLRDRISDEESKLKPLQFLALASMFRYYQKSVYPDVVFTDSNQTDHRVKRFESAVAGKVSDEYLARYNSQLNDPAEREQTPKRVELLLRLIDKWSREVPGSRADINGDTGKSKRAITIGGRDFAEERLQELIQQPNATLTDDLPQASHEQNKVPPPLIAQKYHLGINGESQGPFSLAELKRKVAEGTMGRETLVWTAEMDGWKQAHLVGELSSLFSADRLPPPLPKAN